MYLLGKNSKLELMRFILSLIFVLFFLATPLLSFDEIIFSSKDTVIEQVNDIADSLETKSYEELYKHYNDLRFKDSALANIYASHYFNRAKDDNDTVKLANAYYMFLKLSWNNPSKVLHFSDTIIGLTKNIRDDYYPTRGYISKGIISSRLKKYDDALKFYLLALNYAEVNKNDDHIIACKHNIAILKNTLGKNREALSTFRRNLKIIKSKDTTDQFLYHYIATYYQLGDSYNRLRILDSAQFYLKKGISKSFSSNLKNVYPDLLASYGTNSYLREDYFTAIDTLTKALQLLPKNSNYYINQLYLAKTYSKLNKKDKAYDYLKEIEASTDETNYTNLLRDTFVLLIDHYKTIDDQDNQLDVMEKLIKYDRVNEQRAKVLNKNITKNYDTAQLIKDKDQLIIGIQDRNKKLQRRFLIVSILLIILMTIVYFYYFKKEKKVYEQKVEEKYKDLLKESSYQKPKTTRQIEISQQIVESIIYKLNKFEEDQEFLKNDLTMVKVAKKFKTNSSYLSKVINTHKKRNFANYLNDLRIAFCIKRLNTDKKFRRYSIKSIALETGFNSIQSFSAAFQKRIGQNPSDYIHSIENQ